MTRKATETLAQFNDRIHKRDEEDIRSLLKTPYGKRFIHKIIFKVCRVFDNPFSGEDTHTTYFTLGQQNTGKTLLAQVLEIRPEALIEMNKIDKEDGDARKHILEALQQEYDSGEP